MAAAGLDDTDALADLRARYRLPAGVIHLDGTCGQPATPPLRQPRSPRTGGRRPVCAQDPDARRIETERTVTRLAGLLGAEAADVAVAESMSMSLFHAMLCATALRPDRTRLLIDRSCFLDAHYLARSAAQYSGRELITFNGPEELATLLDERVALVTIGHTDHHTGAVRDARALTRTIQDTGALTMWGLSDSTGALCVDLPDWGTDFAIGCGSRYLGGGVGAPAYSFASAANRARLRELVPRRGTQCSGGVPHPLSTGLPTPSSLSLSRLHHSLSHLAGVTSAMLAGKTRALVTLFVQRVREQCGEFIDVLTPTAGMDWGSQVGLRHPRAQQLSNDLYARGVITSCTEPDVIRFSFAPAWVSHVDVWEAVDQLHELLAVLNRPGSTPASHPLGR